MKPSVSLELQRQAVHLAAARYQTTNPSVLGSVVRGDDADGSDLDLLTPGDLPVKFRAKVLSEARPV